MYQVNYPVAFHTVDIAAVKGLHHKQVLMIRKKNEPENVWRFPGGFIDVADKSAEEAAARELREETGLELVNYDEYVQYLGSSKINDKRFEGGPHGILTSFFLVNYTMKSPNAKAGDDAVDAKWINLHELSKENVNEVHWTLMEMLQKYFENYLYYKRWENVEKEFATSMKEHLENMQTAGQEFSELVGETTDKIISEIKTIFESLK